MVPRKYQSSRSGKLMSDDEFSISLWYQAPSLIVACFGKMRDELDVSDPNRKPKGISTVSYPHARPKQNPSYRSDNGSYPKMEICLIRHFYGVIPSNRNSST